MSALVNLMAAERRMREQGRRRGPDIVIRAGRGFIEELRKELGYRERETMTHVFGRRLVVHLR